MARILIRQAIKNRSATLALCNQATSRMPIMFTWETINNFGSLRERDEFVVWLQQEIALGLAQEVTPTAPDDGERWYKHLATGSLWRLVSDENPYGPGFWPVYEEMAA